jgi:hypothetical protein
VPPGRYSMGVGDSNMAAAKAALRVGGIKVSLVLWLLNSGSESTPRGFGQASPQSWIEVRE